MRRRTEETAEAEEEEEMLRALAVILAAADLATGERGRSGKEGSVDCGETRRMRRSRCQHV